MPIRKMMEARPRFGSHRLWREAEGGAREARDRGEHGAVLVEYGMILVAVLLVSFALIQIIGGRVLEMFQGVLPGFG